jgi:hypothetical protein
MGHTPRLALLLGLVYNKVSGILIVKSRGFSFPDFSLRNLFLLSRFQECSHVVLLDLL